MSFLEIHELVAGYGNAVVLRDVCLSIDEGEAVALVGRNGAGKSTLMLSIFGALSAAKYLLQANESESPSNFASVIM